MHWYFEIACTLWRFFFSWCSEYWTYLFCSSTFSQIKIPILKSLFQRSIFVFSPMQALHPPSFFNHYIGYRFPLAGNFYTHPCMHERIFAFFPSKWLLFRITLKHAAFKSGSFSFAVLRSFLSKRALRTLWDTFFPFEKLIYSCISMQRRMNLVPCRGRSQSISLKISFLRSFQDRIIFSNLF